MLFVVKEKEPFKTHITSASKLRLLSFNPNSIGKNPKRAKIIQALRKKNANIILLSDTRLSKEIEPTVKNEWGGKANFASFTSQARGVAVLFAKNLAIEILEDSIYNDESGNFTVLNIKYESFVITISCIYGPNQDNPDFYEKVVFHEVQKCQEVSDFCIIGGDWNIALDQTLDTFGYTTENNINAKKYILTGLENLGLLDIFRYLNPYEKRYSWRQFGGIKRARLDFFLVSSTLLPFVANVDILPGINSDHSIPVLDIDFARFQRGKGFFKFNNSLVNDKEYIDIILKAIRDVTIRYVEDIYNPAFLITASPEQLQSLILTINPQLFLECLILEIRGKTISYCAWKKKCKNGAQNLALHKLELAEVASDREPDSDDLRRQLDMARQEVERFNSQDAEGAQCRARTQWQVDGEKPSKFFCNLEKYNAVQKYIPQLNVKDADNKDVTVSDQKHVEKEIFKFYQNLYKSQEVNLSTLTIEKFLDHENLSHPMLTENLASNLEGEITVKEATKYLKKCRSDASPGSSGFTGGFYKLFWRNLKYSIVNSLNFAYETGNLSVSQKLGVIILLPKPDKDKRFLANWRPISLLNHIYKILSGALAERLKPVLQQIIHPDQKGFVSGRYIGECIRNTYDTIEYAKSKNRAGLLLLIDFEKAFDSISHSFIIKSLHFFGFGFSFIKWINLLLNDVYSCINHCGNISERFKVGRSCRQGDPISPYLFIICVEILAIKIRKDSAVKGFKLGNYMQKIDFYADDLTAYLDGSKNSLVNVINILDNFRNISGLKINLTKCKAVWIGKNRFLNINLCEEYGLIWTNKFRLLGVDFDSDLAQMDTNFESKITEINKLFKSWMFRHLTPFGRVTVIKSMALSKLGHLVLVCPHMGTDNVGKLKSLIFKFLWNNKPDRMKRKHAMLPTSRGGINLPDLEMFWASLKMSWARRLMTSSGLWQKILELNLLYADHDIDDVWFGGPTKIKLIASKISNIFWKETLNIFALSVEEMHFAKPYFFFNFNVFDNNFFSINGTELKSSEFSTLWRKKICQAGQFFNCYKSPPEFISLVEFNVKYNLNLNFLSYHRIKEVIKNAMKYLNYKIFDEDKSDIRSPMLPIIHKLSCLQSKGCRLFYELLKTKEWSECSTSDCESKWHNELGINLSVMFWNKIWDIQKTTICSNKIKWINLQILRFILPTNYSVSKYNTYQDPGCSFCGNHLELLPTLVWSCPKVRELWNIVENILVSFFPDFRLGMKEAIFGDYNSKGNSVINTIILLAKHFIWIQKFSAKNLNELHYKLFMKKELYLLLKVMQEKNLREKFENEWANILEHFGVL